MNSRDKEWLHAIVANIEKLESKISRHHITQEKFLADDLYKDSVAMLVFNITEYVNKLSADIKQTYGEIPWQMIVGMRNKFAHGYDGMIEDFIWDVAVEHLPDLKIYCRKILSSLSSGSSTTGIPTPPTR